MKWEQLVSDANTDASPRHFTSERSLPIRYSGGLNAEDAAMMIKTIVKVPFYYTQKIQFGNYLKTIKITLLYMWINASRSKEIPTDGVVA